MKRTINYLAAALCIALAGASCTKDPESDTSVKETEFTLALNMPISVENPSLKSAEAIFTDTRTGLSTKANEFEGTPENGYSLTSRLKEGVYDMSLSGEITFMKDEATFTAKIEAQRKNIAVSGATGKITVESSISTLKNDNFVIEEIFFTGTVKPDNSPYYGDQYMKITNNSDKTLYADGLVILQSAFLTVDKYNYTPDIMSTHFSINSGVIFPGSGTDYPVKPGESVIFADTAIDHTKSNSNSMDLSAATFENYNEYDDEDVDNPSVANVTTLFSDDIWTFHNRGFYTYAIGRLGDGVTAEKFASDYMYTVSYDMVVPDYGTFPMSDDCWKFPNGWLTDAVNLSIEEKFAWTVTSPAIDSGWTYCGKIDGDDTRFGKSVRRISAGEKEGRTIYKDTNNSTADFIPESVPSLKK